MRTLIIGGAGLLGTHLAPTLQALGYEVALCDNFSGSLQYRTSDAFRVFTTNATDFNAMQHVMAVFRPEIVIVSLGYTLPKDAVYRFFEDTRIALGSANVLSSLLDKSVKHVYFCSSHEVYGGPQSRKPLKETRKIKRSTNHIGAAKLASEQLLQFRCIEMGIGFTALRIFDLFGPRITFSARTGIVSFLIDSLLRFEMLGFVGARKKRDFIHVEDAAPAVSGVIESGYTGIVNIGSGAGVTLMELTEALCEKMKVVYLPDEVPDGRLPTFSAVADTSRLKSIIPGWEPQHNVIDSLPELIEFRRKEAEFYSRSNPLAVLNAMRGINNV